MNGNVSNDSNCFDFFLQAEIQKIFKGFDEMDLFWESAIFAVGLSGLTSIFTRHLLQLFVENKIEYMIGQEGSGRVTPNCLIPLLQCAKEIPFAGCDMFCNPYISFVTRVPWEMRSKLYIFGEKAHYLCGLSQGKGDFETTAPEKCSISVYNPSIGLADTLRVISGLNQSITTLYLVTRPELSVVDHSV